MLPPFLQSDERSLQPETFQSRNHSISLTRYKFVNTNWVLPQYCVTTFALLRNRVLTSNHILIATFRLNVCLSYLHSFYLQYCSSSAGSNNTWPYGTKCDLNTTNILIPSQSKRTVLWPKTNSFFFSGNKWLFFCENDTKRLRQPRCQNVRFFTVKLGWVCSGCFTSKGS
jgi:hypothetical protein